MEEKKTPDAPTWDTQSDPSSTPREGELFSTKKNGDEIEHVAEREVAEYSPEETKRIMRKVDWMLLPQLSFLYLLAFLDRGNIGNAKVAGMNKDLNLHGMQYNIALTVFFIPYALLEVPSNIILKMMRPSLWISIMMTSWGLVMTLMGIVKNYEGLVAARFFLGVAESGYFPAAAFLLTTWYRRYEVQTRMSIFYAGASLSGAFSGLLAFAISKMNGLGGLEGWRWIFILEGMLTVIVGFIACFTLPDSPREAGFLTQEERRFVATRLETETGTGKGRVTNDDRIEAKYIWAALREWKIWTAVWIFWGNSISVYGFTYTVPTVIVELGYSAANAQLLTVPIYVAAMITVIVVAVSSDRVQLRSPFIIGSYCVGSLGFIALLAIPHPAYPGLTYGMLFPAAMGIYAPLIPTLTWTANNLAPSSKRAVGMALLISLGNLGGIAGSNIFLERMKPNYWLGYGFCVGIMMMAIATAFFLRWEFMRLNKQKLAMTEEEVRAKWTEEELLEMGDKSPFFKYAI